MKKRLSLILSLLAAMSLSGCSASEALDRFTGADHEDAQVASDIPVRPTGQRVYMDEISGILSDFDGAFLYLKKDDTAYQFDVSSATVECMHGLLCGDEISVIYEGQMTGEATDTVKALKVTDALHKKNPLEDRTIKGSLDAISSGTLRITTNKKKRSLTCPLAGTGLYFENGIRSGAALTLTVLGDTPLLSEDPPVMDGEHIAVLSVSDGADIQVPAPPEISAPDVDPAARMQELRGSVVDLTGSALRIRPEAGTAVLSLDLTNVPSYFPGGCAAGSSVSVYFTGEYDETNPGSISVDRVIGSDPAGSGKADTSGFVTGTVIGSTANTLTILTGDGAAFTCYTGGVQNYATDTEPGSELRITFLPDAGRQSNIHNVLKIEDA